MRARFVNEKFTEKSDPVKDMGIGIKVKIEKLHKKWDKEFKDNIEGAADSQTKLSDALTVVNHGDDIFGKKEYVAGKMVTDWYQKKIDDFESNYDNAIKNVKKYSSLSDKENNTAPWKFEYEKIGPMTQKYESNYRNANYWKDKIYNYYDEGVFDKYLGYHLSDKEYDKIAKKQSDLYDKLDKVNLDKL